jgi:hypothetical protein
MSPLEEIEFEAVCKRITELEAENARLLEALGKWWASTQEDYEGVVSTALATTDHS